MMTHVAMARRLSVRRMIVAQTSLVAFSNKSFLYNNVPYPLVPYSCLPHRLIVRDSNVFLSTGLFCCQFFYKFMLINY